MMKKSIFAIFSAIMLPLACIWSIIAVLTTVEQLADIDTE